MTKDEALRLALDAFNKIAAWNDGEVGSHMDEPYAADISRKTITAIKAALEAKDEPVAWRAPNWGHSPDEYVYRDFDDPVMGIDGKPSPNNEPLYTTPPQRKPLTDEEIRRANHHMVDGAYDYSFKQGVRWAEKMHGIKWEWEK